MIPVAFVSDVQIRGLQPDWTFWLEVDVLEKRCAGHQFSVHIEFTTSPGDQMAVLRDQTNIRPNNAGAAAKVWRKNLTCDPKSRMRMVSNWSCIAVIL